MISALAGRGDAESLFDAPPVEIAAEGQPIEAASLDGSQVIARIDGQVVQACEVLWRVNLRIEQNREQIPPEQVEAIRQQLLQMELGGLLDRKLLYGEFRRTVPAENIPHVEQQLLKVFEEKRLPQLLKQLEVKNTHELELKLTQLGSSFSDVRQSFNEEAIAGEWVRSKIKINEEVSPDEMLAYYQGHLADYDFPAKVRWEELLVLKARFREPALAYAEMAHMGNEVWQQAAAKPLRGPAFAEIAKARSHGLNAAQGGVHDWTSRGALRTKVVDDALFSLIVGQMSPILESETAFHVVRVLERTEAGRRPFTEVQSDIREKLKEERFQAALQQYLGRLRADARIWTVFKGNVSADELLGRKPGDAPSR